MQQIQPKLQELQKRYKNDKEKLSQEQSKLYKENGINPGTSCISMLIQMPILIAVYDVIRRPLSFMLSYGADEVEKLTKGISGAYPEIQAAVENNLINMKFLGFWDLSKVPSWHFQEIASDPMTYIPLLLIPILCAVTTYISLRISSQIQKGNYANNQQNKQASPQGQAMQKSMTWIFPLFTLFLAFSVPAALGLYWFIGYIIQILQQVFITRRLYKKMGENK